MRNKATTITRFLLYVDSKKPYGPWCNCWKWTGTIHLPTGYGKFWFRNKRWQAHRISWMLFRGRLPKDLQVQHLCNTRRCVNPHHLILGTELTNAQYRVLCGRGYDPKGEKNNNVKLSNDDIHRIRKKAQIECHCMKRLAKEYGVNYSTINRIVNRKRWLHI